MLKNQDPLQQISRGNAWYLDDQFVKQYEQSGARAVIENRWRIFEESLSDFIGADPQAARGKVLRILDAGCGDGINLVGLSQIIKKHGWACELYGTDYNPLRVGRATNLALAKDIVQSSLNSLPHDDGFFDVVLCNHVLEHIPDDEVVLRELKRVIRPKGMLILGVPNEGCFLARLRNHVFQRSILKTTDHVNFYTPAILSALLKGTGFQLQKVEMAGFFLPHFALQYLVAKFQLGRRLLDFLGRVWRSQSADLITTSLN